MALSNAVWGIDIGQCALKALRCTLDDDGQTLIADAFDYIEYEKILSQPEADRPALIRDAIAKFLERNDVRRDKVAISVPGQAGLARFFKPPPVDPKVISQIVKYEARQQIPFPLEDVIWDYQLLGGMEVDGFILDAEVGLFAMKREHVYRAIKPLTDAGVEPYFVQLAPLAVFNYAVNDIMGGGPDQDAIDAGENPDSTIVLSVGTETTDLVVTNGAKIWQRSIPLGGNHFTKQLSRELKLTFAQAEHLKRNARQADNAKQVFQVMRPVFNDFVTEIQRSISYFQTLDRQTKIDKMVMLGNTVKLPGLRQYLAKNLGHDVIKVDEFQLFKGTEVKSSPQFKENVLSYPVCYGLCLQGLKGAKLQTNLLPREIETQRLVREKKPWAVAALAAFLLAFTFNYFFHYNSWATAHPTYYEVDGSKWKDAIGRIENVQRQSVEFKGDDEKLVTEVKHVKNMGEEVTGNADRKLVWLELFRAINAALPRDETYKGAPTDIRDPKVYPYFERKELHIEHIESQFFAETGNWFTPGVQKRWKEGLSPGRRRRDEPTEETAEDAAAEPAVEISEDQLVDADGNPVEPPSGPGWIIEIKGYHYHNKSSTQPQGWGPTYLSNTLLKNLREGKVRLPIEAPKDGKPPATSEFTMEELGISFPILAKTSSINRAYRVPNPDYIPPATAEGEGGPGAPGTTFGEGSTTSNRPVKEDPDNPQYFAAPRYDFVIQFCWHQKRLSERLAAREEERKRLEAEGVDAEDTDTPPTSEDADAATPPADVSNDPATPAADGAATPAGGE